MNLFQGQSRLRTGVLGLTSLALSGLLFGSGYWLGEIHAKSVLASGSMPVLSSYPTYNSQAGSSRLSASTLPILPMHTGLLANATPKMKEFAQNRTALMAKLADLRKQNSNASGDPKAFAQFQQQNAALLQRQKELSQTIAQQQRQNPMAYVPQQIPPNASPQLRAYLTTRDQLMKDQTAFMNEHRADDPAVRQAAMQQWRQEHAPVFQQLQQQSQAIAQMNRAPSPTANTATK